MITDLFADQQPRSLPLAPGVVLLPSYAPGDSLLTEIQHITTQAPFRQMRTPGGRSIAVAMTNCGELGWISAPGGYRYSPTDPLSGQPWPAMPRTLRDLARQAAALAGFADFYPDACLINRYAIGNRMGAHRDQDECDYRQPIVSVSLGLAAVFVLHGEQRGGRGQAIPLDHEDVLVFGGPARHYYHSVRALKAAEHPLTGGYRYNLTFRRAA